MIEITRTYTTNIVDYVLDKAKDNEIVSYSFIDDELGKMRKEEYQKEIPYNAVLVYESTYNFNTKEMKTRDLVHEQLTRQVIYKDCKKSAELLLNFAKKVAKQ